jgi:hypothetical protein
MSRIQNSKRERLFAFRSLLLRTVTALLLGLLLCAVGCDDDHPTRARDELTGAETPDRLVELLVQSLNQRNFALYQLLLHEDYEFQFPVDEFDLAETANGRWPLTRDLASMERLMNGSPSKDGEIVLAVDLSLVADPIPWSANVETEFAGSQRRTFTVRLAVTVSGGTVYQIRGKHELYVVQNGELWQLLFYRDNGVELTKHATDSRSYGAIKSLYEAS